MIAKCYLLGDEGEEERVLEARHSEKGRAQPRHRQQALVEAELHVTVIHVQQQQERFARLGGGDPWMRQNEDRYHIRERERGVKIFSAPVRHI